MNNNRFKPAVSQIHPGKIVKLPARRLKVQNINMLRILICILCFPCSQSFNITEQRVCRTDACHPRTVSSSQEVGTFTIALGGGPETRTLTARGRIQAVPRPSPQPQPEPLQPQQPLHLLRSPWLQLVQAIAEEALFLLGYHQEEVVQLLQEPRDRDWDVQIFRGVLRSLGRDLVYYMILQERLPNSETELMRLLERYAQTLLATLRWDLPLEMHSERNAFRDSLFRLVSLLLDKILGVSRPIYVQEVSSSLIGE